ncbi:TPA: restriction endonuclease subunit S [Salmonella enterica subsp. enterica serovar Concord]|uniref:Restriction endonuclease subunit S n=1 Tax=Salmonella enterica subsp. enterica serovar Concord TaxID=483687 RepID=A0A2R4DG79_SALET|nr:restriction endonuclease subunit S [Salmonella enterica]ECD4124377.1 restriction endonuclease subunit S [Salmonella enterica subsp. enterica serovar Galiema]ECF6967309.1 restriction endonuclease subunit S [Salmonella enterica subsp. enterica]ECU0361022.1 restriction endonuclease subunit S [Salmonella enterica subsp. enterica serovar Litchfield]AVS53831.1 restriction endonuclease subunit S [Salmonella enterica subsp. enterica serovar Concord]AXD21054.1 restriction endonuclease subunit S [Sal
MSWPMVRLGDVAPAIPVKNVDLDKGELVWQLNLDQVESNTGKIIDKVKQPLSSAGSSTHFFNNEHVLYSKLRPYLNKVVVPDELGIATTELVPMKPDPKRLNKRYLAYYLRSKPFVEWVSTQVSGAKMPRVVMNIFWQHEMPLPPLYEQERIVAILDKSDGIYQKREQAIKLADNLLQTTFQKKFNEQTLLLNGWELKELKDIALIQTGPFGTQLHKEDYVENGIPLINPTNIKNGIIIPNFNLCVNYQKYDKLKEYHLKKGDIIMGRRGEMGRCALINDKEDGWFCGTGSLFIRLNTPNEIFSFYLNEYLSSDSIKKFLQKESRGVTMANLNKDIVGKIKINIPPANVLTSFMKIKLKVDSIKKKISHSDSEELLSSLSKKYFQIQNPL